MCSSSVGLDMDHLICVSFFDNIMALAAEPMSLFSCTYLMGFF